MRFPSLSVLILFAALTACERDITPSDLERIKDQELREASQKAFQEKAEIDLLLRVSNMQMEISLVDEDVVETEFLEQISPPDHDAIDKQLTAFFASLYFQQDISPPNSYIHTYLDRFALDADIVKDHWFKYYHLTEPGVDAPRSRNLPEIRLKTLYFADQSKKRVDTLLSHNEDRQYHLSVSKETPQYIDRIDAQVTYEIPEFSTFRFSQADETHNLAGQELRLQNITMDTATIIMPEVFADSVVEVYGFHANGKPLVPRGSSGNSYPSAENLDYLARVSQTYHHALSQVLSDRIESREALDSFLAAQISPPPVSASQIHEQRYRFAGPVEHIVLHILTGNMRVMEQDITLARHTSELKPHQGFYIATDKGTGMQGFVDEHGEWVIPPIAKELSQRNTHFYVDTSNYDDLKLYWLDVKGKRLVKKDFILDENDIYEKKLVNVEKYLNGPEGVFNVETGRMIIPMKYNYLNFREGYFITSGMSHAEIFDRNGNSVITGKYDSIEVENGRIYTQKNVNDFYYDDIFDLRGNKLTDGTWDILQRPGKDNIVHVKRCRKEIRPDGTRYTHGCKYYYLNRQGKVVIDASAYTHSRAFSHGLAAVREANGKWGYIDTSGDVVIPFTFDEAQSFQAQYAYVVSRREGPASLINRRGEIVKTLPDKARSMSIPLDGDGARYDLYNGESYDANGERIVSP